MAKGMSGMTRRHGSAGARRVPPLPMGTFGWMELIGAVSTLRSARGAANCDVHGFMALIRNETTS
eukprot:15857-Lingulodinium_polyedra.AAC.1